jgi:hypothetical protein
LRRKAVSSAIPDEPNDSTPQVGAKATVLGHRFLRLEVTVDLWRFAFVLDPEPATGELRDVAETVARACGVTRDIVLDAMVAAMGQPTIECRRAVAA